MSGTDSHRAPVEEDDALGHKPIGRRSFLAQATAITGGLIAGHAVAAQAPSVEWAAVMKIASFLTGKPDLSEGMVSRAFAALQAEHPGFEQRLKILAERIETAQLPDVDAFRASPMAADTDLMSTAVALVRALYTGQVGVGFRGHFIAYEEALMYRPTRDVSVIPTYAKGGPGYWVEAPK